MKKVCEICGTKIKKSNDASIIGVDLIERVRKAYKKNEVICMDCKKDLLYANILSPY